MGEERGADYTQCPRCRGVFSGDAAYCPYCGLKIGSKRYTYGDGCLKLAAGCGCLLIIASVALFFILKVIWPCLAPLLLVGLVLVLLQRA